MAASIFCRRAGAGTLRRISAASSPAVRIGLLATLLADGTRDASAEPLFTVLVDQIGQVVSAKALD